MSGETIGTAFVAIRPETTGFSQELQAGILPGVKAVAAGIGAVFAASKVADFLGDSIAQARDAELQARQTAAAITSTGGAANVTSRDMDKLTAAEQDKIAVDDDVIRKSANMLLTFTNVRNEVGKGNDIFTQATAVAQDMAAALGEDNVSAALQLGKALNSPVDGVTALQRVGVRLTDQQKEQVKVFVESGDVMSAQKIILGELTKEFGGSAAAQATDADRLGVAWGNLQEKIGGALIPLLDGISRFGVGVVAFLSDATDAVGGFVNAAPAFLAALTAIGFALNASLGVIGLFATFVGTMTLLANKLGLIGGEAQDTSNRIGGLANAINSLPVDRAVSQFTKFQASADGVSKKLGTAHTSLTAFVRLANESPAAAEKLIRGMQAQGIATDDYQRALALATGTPENHAAATAAQNAENGRLLASIEDINDATIKAAGGQLGYEQSVLDVTKAQQDLDTAIKDHGPDSDEAREATIRLAQANVGAASAANENDKAQEALLAQYKDSPGSIDQEIAKLKESQRLHPEIAASYQPMIDKLIDLKAKIEALPAEKPINIFLTGDIGYQLAIISDALAHLPGGGLTGVVSTVGSRASGGPVGAGDWLVGERGNGAEHLHLDPGSSGYVTNAQQTAQGGGLFDGATVIIGETGVISDLDYWNRTRMAGV